MSIAAAFETSVDVDHRRRLAWTSTGAIALYAVLALVMFAWAGSARPEPEEEKRIEVLFQPPPEEAPPPPPPPPIAVPRARPVVHEVTPEAAPAETPAPAPREAPLPVARPTGPTGGSAGLAGGGAGGGEVDEPATPTPLTPPPVAIEKPKTTGPINLPEEADPPEPDEGNEQPEYPAAAREAALSAVVILKIAISERGEVLRVDVLKGDEPFVASALIAVRRWHYQPARLEGEAIAVWKIVKVTFRP